MIASDGARSSTISAQNRSVIALVAVESLGQRGARRVIDRPLSGTVAAGRVIDPAVPVRVLEIGRAGRDVGARDRGFAVPAQPLGEGRHVQGAAGRAAHPVREIGMPGRAADEPVAFVERHRIAEQPVPRRQAAGRDRGGAGPRRRGKDAAMRGEPGAALAQFDRNGVSSGPIRSARRLSQMTMTARVVPFMARPPFRVLHSARNRRYRNCAAGAIARSSRSTRRDSGRDSRNGTVCSPAPPCERSRCPASADRSCSAALAPITVLRSPVTTRSASRSCGNSKSAAASSRVSTASMPGKRADRLRHRRERHAVPCDRPARTSRARRDGARTGR